MKFLAVFVTLAAVAYGYPPVSSWTLNQLSDALQSPHTDPLLIPYLEHALNELMFALQSGHQMESINVVLPPEITGVGSETDFVDVWPVQTPEEEPSFIDVWPVQTPEVNPVSPVAPAPEPVEVQSSSPLVQIIVNVKQASDVSSVAAAEEIERPVPVQVDEPLPSWGNFI